MLNRNPVPLLDTCVGELLREEQRLITQEAMSHEVVVFKPMTVAYTAQSIGKGRDMRHVQCFSCKKLDIFLGVVVKSSEIIASSKVILYLIVPHILHDQHNVRCKHFMQLQIL